MTTPAASPDPPQPPDDARRARLRRVEGILDRWLDLFEAALDEARPDPTKTTELAGVFTMIKRIHEIDHLVRKIAALEDAVARHDDHAHGFRIDPDLLGDGIPGDDEAGDDA